MGIFREYLENKKCVNEETISSNLTEQDKQIIELNKDAKTGDFIIGINDVVNKSQVVVKSTPDSLMFITGKGLVSLSLDDNKRQLMLLSISDLKTAIKKL